MESRKSKQANLETRKNLYFQIGITLAIALALVAFEWTTRIGADPVVIHYGSGEVYNEEIIPPTSPAEIKPPPPPDPVIERIVIHENEVEIEEYDFGNLEIDEGDAIIIPPIEEDEPPETLPFWSIQDKPSFQGGDLNTFRMYIAKKLIFPEVAQQNGVAGRVHLQFVVTENGDVEDVVVIKGVHPDIDAEAIRVVKSSPKWIPGKQNGVAVRVQYQLPLVFMLQ